MSSSKAYYRRLDIIRSTSCILVLLYHLNIIQGGFLAVCVFFVLSGFLECVSALNDEKFSIIEYYKKRIKRIYFPLVIVVALSIIIIKTFSLDYITLKSEALSVLFGYNNFWQLYANFDYFTKHINSPFMHFWFISVLMQFDVIFPLFFIGFKKLEKNHKNVAILMVALFTFLSIAIFIYLSITKEMMIVYYNSFARWFSILFGMFYAIILYEFGPRLPRSLKQHNSFVFKAYLLILIALCLLISSKLVAWFVWMIVISLISLRLIRYAIVKKEKINKAIQLFSKCTYEIYLVQYPILFLVSNVLNSPIKEIVTFISSIFVGTILHNAIYYNFKKGFGNVFKGIGVGALIVISAILLMMTPDYTSEMNELKEKLDDDLKVMEDRNEEYSNRLRIAQEKIDNMRIEIESGEIQIAEIVKNLPVVGVGDSVMLAASSGLYKVFPNGYFDGKVSRTIVGGKEVLEDLMSKNKVGDIVILALANNGDYIEKRNISLMELLKDKQVYWINAVKADIPEFNSKFKEFAKNYPNVHIIDWEEASKDHPEYFYADGIHVKNDGITAYANLVYDTIYNDYLEQYRNEKNEILKKYEEELNSITEELK